MPGKNRHFETEPIVDKIYRGHNLSNNLRLDISKIADNQKPFNDETVQGSLQKELSGMSDFLERQLDTHVWIGIHNVKVFMRQDFVEIVVTDLANGFFKYFDKSPKFETLRQNVNKLTK